MQDQVNGTQAARPPEAEIAEIARVGQRAAMRRVGPGETSQSEAPSTTDALVQATNANIDRVTSAVTEDLDKLKLVLEDVQRVTRDSGERAKRENLAHLETARGAERIRKSIEQSVQDLCANRAKLVEGSRA